MADEESKKIGDSHPLGPFLDEWVEWVEKEQKGETATDYDEGEDIFKLTRDGLDAVLYTSEIDEDFYGEAEALFVESEIGHPPDNLDLSQTLKFSGNELVLSRVSLSDRHGKSVLLVESACPTSKVEVANFDLMVREVATIGRDLRKHLASVLEAPQEEEEEEEED